MTEDRQRHLELIQGIITRLAGNSFLIRGWSVTLVSALFALTAKGVNIGFVYVSYFPCIMFAGLDAYYLCMERRFRALYDEVRCINDAQADFSMAISKKLKESNSWATSFFSKTVLSFHGILLGVIIFVMFKLLQ